MRKIDLTEVLPDIVLKFQREQKGTRVPVFLTLPHNLPAFPWADNSLEILIIKLFDRAIAVGDIGKPIRVAVAKRKTVSDLEALLNLHPSHWIQLRIAMQSLEGLDDCVQQELEKSGYNSEDKWETENSADRLIVYHPMNQSEPQLLFWVENRKGSHRYILLIPVKEPATHAS